MLENYFYKKNRKILNILYLSLKYKSACQVWFKNKTDYYQKI